MRRSISLLFSYGVRKTYGAERSLQSLRALQGAFLEYWYARDSKYSPQLLSGLAAVVEEKYKTHRLHKYSIFAACKKIKR